MIVPRQQRKKKRQKNKKKTCDGVHNDDDLTPPYLIEMQTRKIILKKKIAYVAIVCLFTFFQMNI